MKTMIGLTMVGLAGATLLVALLQLPDSAVASNVAAKKEAPSGGIMEPPLGFSDFCQELDHYYEPGPDCFKYVRCNYGHLSFINCQNNTYWDQRRRKCSAYRDPRRCRPDGEYVALEDIEDEPGTLPIKPTVYALRNKGNNKQQKEARQQQEEQQPVRDTEGAYLHSLLLYLSSLN